MAKGQNYVSPLCAMPCQKTKKKNGKKKQKSQNRTVFERSAESGSHRWRTCQHQPAFLRPFGRSETRQLPKYPDSQAMGIRMFSSGNQKYQGSSSAPNLPSPQHFCLNRTNRKVPIRFPVEQRQVSFFGTPCTSQRLFQVGAIQSRPGILAVSPFPNSDACDHVKYFKEILT